MQPQTTTPSAADVVASDNDLQDLNRDLKSLLYDGKVYAATIVLTIQSFSFALAFVVRGLVLECVSWLTGGSSSEKQCASAATSTFVSFCLIFAVAWVILLTYTTTRRAS